MPVSIGTEIFLISYPYILSTLKSFCLSRSLLVLTLFVTLYKIIYCFYLFFFGDSQSLRIFHCNMECTCWVLQTFVHYMFFGFKSIRIICCTLHHFPHPMEYVIFTTFINFSSVWSELCYVLYSMYIILIYHIRKMMIKYIIYVIYHL